MKDAPFYEVCIVGGGPAGCAAAIRLATHGCQVLLVEMGDYCAEHPGEVLAASCAPALDALGVSVEWRELPYVVSLWGFEQALETASLLHPFGGGRAVRRGEFEACLAQAARSAGAHVHLGRRLVGSARTKNGWELNFATRGDPQSVYAGFVIDAGGRRMPFARRQGSRAERAGDLLALACWTSPQPEAAEALQGMHIEAVQGGWWYAVARPDGSLAAAFFTRAETLRRMGGMVAAWQTALERSTLVATLLTDEARRPGRLKAYSAAPALACPPGGSGWIAAGDAAICFDPLKGDGVRHALETGMRAAEAAHLPPAKRDTVLPYYADVLRDRFEEHLRTRRQVYEQAAARLGGEFLEG